MAGMACGKPKPSPLADVTARATKCWDRFCTIAALSFWAFGLLFNALGLCIAILMLPNPRAALFIATQLALLMIPLKIPPPAWAAAFIRRSHRAGMEYFPTRVVYEDASAFKHDQPYVFAFEPHSALPLDVFVFENESRTLPESIRGRVRILASTAGFWSPIMRNFWWWCGIRPVSKQVMRHLLSKGTSVMLCPGGVRECMYLRRGKEAVFLRQRHGFVRVAMEAGAPLVPVFAFGQTRMYSWWRPFIDFPRNVVPPAAWASVARRLAYLPMLLWGRYGTPLPRRVPQYVVVGKPLSVPHVANPDPAEVEKQLTRFIEALCELVEAHKGAAGYPDLELLVH